MDYQLLYQRYLDKVEDALDEDMLFDILGASLDNIECEYGSLSNYAEPDKPNMVLDIYSVREAEYVYKMLNYKIK